MKISTGIKAFFTALVVVSLIVLGQALVGVNGVTDWREWAHDLGVGELVALGHFLLTHLNSAD